ncbi:MAG: hypothetical protein HC803_10765 [Saprospiraceae bacterium]|nr:hypothetical protein [Saprospiraceae bacterium]
MKSLFAILVLFLSNPSVIQTDEVLPYPDNSLHVEQYQSLGMPSPDEIWNAAEYKRAVKVIKGYYDVDKWSIPRKESEYSGALFERMTKIENFEIITDKTENIQERLREHDDLLHSVGQLMSMYVEPYEDVQRLWCRRFDAQNVIPLERHFIRVGVLKDLQGMMSDRGQRNSDLDLMTDKLMVGVSTTIEEYLLIIEHDFHQYQSKDLEWFAAELLDWSIKMKDYLSDAQILTLTKNWKF